MIVEANGETVDGFNDLQRIVAINLDRELVLGVQREGGRVEIGLIPDVIEQDDGFGRKSRIGRVGVVAASEREFRQLGPVGAVVEAVDSVWETSVATLRAVGDMIVGKRSITELRGPAGIVELAGEVAKLGIVPLINLAAFLSISLGLINLFPIPMLDGGHLLFYAVEAVRGKPVGEAAQEVAYALDWVWLSCSCLWRPSMISVSSDWSTRLRAVLLISSAGRYKGETGSVLRRFAIILCALLVLPAVVLAQSIFVRDHRRREPAGFAETVRSYMRIDPGSAFSASELNRALKRLYDTGLFADVNFRSRAKCWLSAS